MDKEVLLFDPITCHKQLTTLRGISRMCGVRIEYIIRCYEAPRKIRHINCYVLDVDTGLRKFRELMANEKIDDEFWIDIEGTRSAQVSSYGRYRYILNDKITYYVIGSLRLSPPKITITITGKDRTFPAQKLVADYFLEKPSGDSMIIYHKDGNSYNNRVENLCYMSKSKVSSIVAALSKRIAVVKKDPSTGEIIDEYTSMRQASEKNGFSHSVIAYNIKKGILCQGFLYEIDKEQF